MARVKSEGKCNFCHQTFSKQGMARHLKACKARQAAYQAAAAPAGAAPRKLLYVQAQGRYAPEYWLHLEMPADLTLYALDDFLRGIWLECCGHLSQFRIGDTFYSIDAGGDWGPSGPPPWDDDDFEDDEDFEDEDDLDMPGDGPWLRLVPRPSSAPGEQAREAVAGDNSAGQGMAVPPLHLLPQTPEDEDDAEDEDADFPFDPDEMVWQFMNYAQASGLETIDADTVIAFVMRQMLGLDEGADLSAAVAQIKAEIGHLLPPLDGLSVSDLAPDLGSLGMFGDFGFGFSRFREESMDVPLGDVLKVGMEFEHEYDFGTTTHLTLKVMDERVGVLVDGKEDNIHIMARNDPPQIVCQACQKKPATQVCSYCLWDWEAQAWFCDDCARQHEHYDEAFLPVVNSPRVGMCGYTGGMWDEDTGDADLDG